MGMMVKAVVAKDLAEVEMTVEEGMGLEEEIVEVGAYLPVAGNPRLGAGRKIPHEPRLASKLQY